MIMSDFDENWQLKSDSVLNSADEQTAQPQCAAPAQSVNQAPVQYAVPAQAYGSVPVNGYGYVQRPVYNTMFEEERQNSLVELTRMLNHFAPKVDIFQKYDRTNFDIARYSRNSKAPLIWGIIVALFSIPFIYNAIFVVKYKDNAIVYFIIAGVFLLFGAGLILLFILKRKHNKKKLSMFCAEAQDLSNQLMLIYNGYGSCPLAPEYTDPRLLFKLQSLIISGRCASIVDALNTLLITQQNYQKILDAKARSDSDTAARYDGKPAFFNAVRYFNLK